MTTVRQQRYKIFCLTLSALPHLGGLFLTVNRNYTEVVNFIVFNRIEGKSLSEHDTLSPGDGCVEYCVQKD